MTKQYLHSLCLNYALLMKVTTSTRPSEITLTEQGQNQYNVCPEDHKLLASKMFLHSQIISLLDFPLQVSPKYELHRLPTTTAMSLPGESRGL